MNPMKRLYYWIRYTKREFNEPEHTLEFSLDYRCPFEREVFGKLRRLVTQPYFSGICQDCDVTFTSGERKKFCQCIVNLGYLSEHCKDPEVLIPYVIYTITHETLHSVIRRVPELYLQGEEDVIRDIGVPEGFKVV